MHINTTSLSVFGTWSCGDVNGFFMVSAALSRFYESRGNSMSVEVLISRQGHMVLGLPHSAYLWFFWSLMWERRRERGIWCHVTVWAGQERFCSLPTAALTREKFFSGDTLTNDFKPCLTETVDKLKQNWSYQQILGVHRACASGGHWEWELYPFARQSHRG